MQGSTFKSQNCAADIHFWVLGPPFLSFLPPADRGNSWILLSIRRAGEKKEKAGAGGVVVVVGGGCLEGSNRWMGRDHEGTWEGCRADTKSSESGFLKDFCKFTV